MGKMSRDKGKRFERQIAALFRDEGFSEAHRTAQFRGNTGQAGDVEGLQGIHVECKHCERMTLYPWVEQAVRDASASDNGSLPVVIHKANNKEILCTMRFSDWVQLYREWSNGNEVALSNGKLQSNTNGILE